MWRGFCSSGDCKSPPSEAGILFRWGLQVPTERTASSQPNSAKRVYAASLCLLMISMNASTTSGSN